MTRKPVTIAPDNDISMGVKRWLKHNILCLPVVDKNNKIKGTVIWKDLIKQTVRTKVVSGDL
jgi:acetoin utilization protein AcuB